jgi:lipopolysaccharide transport system ATP-binding protein
MDLAEASNCMDRRPVIHFENVGKRFVFTADKPQTLLESFISFFSRRSHPGRDRELWAVRNVSFEVMPGQCLGIIGRNGGGKSTILKLIARILRPTTGRIVVRGRVSALLELGAGFHPDLTGRENIFLNASLLGLSKADIVACYDHIVAFSELEEFIDMPVKHYSSGMYMRLGFSVAIHVAPDILIVDEILAVGDQAFQRKCIDHIYSMKRSGTTIVIVSHNLSVVRNLCSHLVWIERGEVRQDGLTEEVAGQYMEYSYGQEARQAADSDGVDPSKRLGDRKIEITHVRILNDTGEEAQTFKTGDGLTIEMAYTAHEPIMEPEFGLAIFRQDGVHVNGPNTQLAGLHMGEVTGSGVVRYHIESLPLLPAKYLVTTAVHDSRVPVAYDFHDQAYSFRIVAGGTEEIFGLMEIPASWEWEWELTDKQPQISLSAGSNGT